MASQAVLIEDTIVGLKRALLRQQSDSAYDEPINQPSNRGNKTKRNAQYVHEGALSYMNGGGLHRKKAEHGGYKRDILQYNPPRYDAEGDELDFEDSDATADADATEDNPFSETHLEALLSPLKHPSELPNHSMANAYTSKAIKTMVERIEKRLRSERYSLWQAKKVYRQFLGDAIWMPCGAVETKNDRKLFEPSNSGLCNNSMPRTRSPSTNQDAAQLHGPAATDGSVKGSPQNDALASQDAMELGVEVNNSMDIDTKDDQDVTMKDSTPQYIDRPTEKPSQTNGDITVPPETGGVENQPEQPLNKSGGDTAIVEDKTQLTERKDDVDDNQVDKQRDQDPDVHNGLETKTKSEEAEDDSSPGPPRRMTTRAQTSQTVNPHSQEPTRQLSPGSLGPTTHNEDNVLMEPHPLFQLPKMTRLDRNYGLPQQEADETRHMLWAYIQKQGESVRLFAEMLEMLRKAYRMKEEVWEWCKTEGHVGELSDGEDWYDRDQWGLAEGEDLKKGVDEDDAEGPDEGRTTGKRGRGRRA